MEFIVRPKGNRFIVEDTKKRTLYTIKKKGFGSKYMLLDASGYELYSLEQTSSGKNPEFKIILNDRVFLSLKCVSVFLNPTIEAEGSDMHFSMKSTDRKNFTMYKNNRVSGSINTVTNMNADLEYKIEVENVDFDDYIPLLALAIEKAFGDINKNK